MGTKLFINQWNADKQGIKQCYAEGFGDYLMELMPAPYPEDNQIAYWITDLLDTYSNLEPGLTVLANKLKVEMTRIKAAHWGDMHSTFVWLKEELGKPIKYVVTESTSKSQVVGQTSWATMREVAKNNYQDIFQGHVKSKEKEQGYNEVTVHVRQNKSTIFPLYLKYNKCQKRFPYLTKPLNIVKNPDSDKAEVKWGLSGTVIDARCKEIT